MAAEEQALRDLYAAINRGDVAAALEVFAEDVERVEPPDYPQGGTYYGLAAMQEHLAKAQATWAEGACEPESILTHDGRTVVLVHVHVRLKTETEFREGRLGDGFTFRDGKATLFRTFDDPHEALRWADIDPATTDWPQG